MTLEDSIHSQRLRVLRDAERLGNVSEACRRHGSRAPCSIGCGSGWSGTGRMACIRNAGRPARPSAGDSGADGTPSDRLRVGLADVRSAVVQRSARARGRDDRSRHGLAAVAPAATRDPSGAPGRAGAVQRGDTGLVDGAHREVGPPRCGESPRATCCRWTRSTWAS